MPVYFNSKPGNAVICREGMTYDTFKEKLCRAVAERLQDTQVKVECKQVTRNNGVKKEVLTFACDTVKETPAAHMEELYEQYLEEGNWESLLERLCDAYWECRKEPGFPLQQFLDYTKAEKRLIYRLINQDKNKELLEQIPYIPYMDLAITFCYLLENIEAGTGTVLITNQHMEHWNVDLDMLWKAAKENTPRLCRQNLCRMEELFGLEMAHESERRTIDMFVLTNTQQIYGAAAILYENVLKDFAKSIRSDFYLLPSSVHEVILVPVQQGMCMETFDTMVKETNQNREVVREEEVLADHAYFYSRKTDTLSR